MNNIVFCFGPEFSGAEDEIWFIGVLVDQFNGFCLVKPILRNHDALIVANQYIINQEVL